MIARPDVLKRSPTIPKLSPSVSPQPASTRPFALAALRRLKSLTKSSSPWVMLCVSSGTRPSKVPPRPLHLLYPTWVRSLKALMQANCSRQLNKCSRRGPRIVTLPVLDISIQPWTLWISTQCSVLTNVVMTKPRLLLGLSRPRGGLYLAFTGHCLWRFMSARRLYYITFLSRFVYYLNLRYDFLIVLCVRTLHKYRV
jgi:hypothetical protein